MRNYITIAIVTLAVTGCNNNPGTGSGSADSTKMNAGDSSVTTTTTVTRHRYSGNFMPQPDVKYLDLRTKKEIVVKIDTVRGEVVNQETNEPVDLFVDPVKHDTIYGQTGSVVNNYITRDESGDYRVDTVRISTVEVQTVAVAPDETALATDKYKEKVKKNKSKEKTDDEKIKEKNDKTKEKDR